MTIPTRRTLLGLVVLPALAACEAPRSAPPRGTALPPPQMSGPLEPAPVPSQTTEDFLAARRAGRTAAPTGPDAMPGLEPGPRIGTDMTTAPIPQGGPRLLERR